MAHAGASTAARSVDAAWQFARLADRYPPSLPPLAVVRWLIRLKDAGTRVVARFGLDGLLSLSVIRIRVGAQRRK